MYSAVLTKAFEKAHKKIGSDKKTHMAQHLADVLLDDYKYQVHERTLRDHYTAFIENPERTDINLKVDLTKHLCQFLGYKDYDDFVKGEISDSPGQGPIPPERIDWKKWGLGIVLAFALLGGGLSVYTIYIDGGCVTWNGKKYVSTDCDNGPFSKFGTDIVNKGSLLNPNLEKLENVTRATIFFDEYTSKPLVWYIKISKTEVEFFTAPGLHPVTGKTLKAVTEYIIETYVPEHIDRADSFVKPGVEERF